MLNGASLTKSTHRLNLAQGNGLSHHIRQVVFRCNLDQSYPLHFNLITNEVILDIMRKTEVYCINQVKPFSFKA